jgi:hypothetical protein
MGGYGIQIRKAEASPRAIDPGDVIFKHHRAGHAQVRIETLTGAHLLHLAVAGCLFNDILRVAAERGITVNQLEVFRRRRLRRRTGRLYWNQLLSADRRGRPKTSYAASSTTANRTPRSATLFSEAPRCALPPYMCTACSSCDRGWVELKRLAHVHMLGLADRRAATVSLVRVIRQLGTTQPNCAMARYETPRQKSWKG